MKRTVVFASLAGCALLTACATNRADHPMVKAAERVIDEITGAPSNPPQSTALNAKPAPDKQ
ncbi:MAG: hypothetical protein JNJ55_01130 [Betaproteobacteria bacterium]|nr:hypothetical protein [Betaproteobacteria bacterium]